MSIRDKIQDWLGIDSSFRTSLDDRLTAVETLVREKAIRIMIGEALEDLIDGKSDGTVKYGWDDTVEVGSKFDTRLKNAVNAPASKIAHDVAVRLVDTKINSEAFIDSVVDRINKKRVVQ